jgi:hypothetical protein
MHHHFLHLMTKVRHCRQGLPSNLWWSSQSRSIHHHRPRARRRSLHLSTVHTIEEE